ncbi:MAG: hypothetical protein KF691_00030 [Phycisphaeraceae bacterium]|nr:hypothetical protein [Phycisphaeraceae bacterium]
MRPAAMRTDATRESLGRSEPDGAVDDADFALFVQGYNMIDFADPAILPPWGADKNADLLRMMQISWCLSVRTTGRGVSEGLPLFVSANQIQPLEKAVSKP